MLNPCAARLPITPNNGTNQRKLPLISLIFNSNKGVSGSVIDKETATHLNLCLPCYSFFYLLIIIVLEDNDYNQIWDQHKNTLDGNFICCLQSNVWTNSLRRTSSDLVSKCTECISTENVRK